jgi:predicted nucleic acid-binding protein
LDAAIFIYYIEDVLPFSTVAKIVFDELERGTFAGVTSVVTLMEILVKPFELGQSNRVAGYEMLLSHYPHLTIAEITNNVARRAAQLRAMYRLRPPDALHLGTALENGATAFVTNDMGLRRVRELSIIMLSDFV